jgi:hypothetical protein
MLKCERNEAKLKVKISKKNGMSPHKVIKQITTRDMVISSQRGIK